MNQVDTQVHLYDYKYCKNDLNLLLWLENKYYLNKCYKRVIIICLKYYNHETNNRFNMISHPQQIPHTFYNLRNNKLNVRV